MYMDFGYLSPSLLFVASSLLTLAGYILFDLLDGGALRSESNRTSKIFLKACWK